MDTILYIAAALVLIGVGWWVIKVATGLLVPLEKTGRAYLLQLLRRKDLAKIVPASCVDECVAESVQFARGMGRLLGKNDQVRTEAVKQLELHADMLGLWVRTKDAFDESYKLRFKSMFERHHVPRLNQ